MRLVSAMQWMNVHCNVKDAHLCDGAGKRAEMVDVSGKHTPGALHRCSWVM